MAQFSRIEVAHTMKGTAMFPLFFSNDIKLSKNVFKGWFDANVTCVSMGLN